MPEEKEEVQEDGELEGGKWAKKEKGLRESRVPVSVFLGRKELQAPQAVHCSC